MQFLNQPDPQGPWQSADSKRHTLRQIPDTVKIYGPNPCTVADTESAAAAALGLTTHTAPLPVRTVTKLTLMARLVALGKWDAFKTALAAAPALVQDAWTLAQDIATSHPMFVDNAADFKAALGLTDAQFAALFDPS